MKINLNIRYLVYLFSAKGLGRGYTPIDADFSVSFLKNPRVSVQIRVPYLVYRFIPN